MEAGAPALRKFAWDCRGDRGMADRRALIPSAGHDVEPSAYRRMGASTDVAIECRGRDTARRCTHGRSGLSTDEQGTGAGMTMSQNGPSPTPDDTLRHRGGRARPHDRDLWGRMADPAGHRRDPGAARHQLRGPDASAKWTWIRTRRPPCASRPLDPRCFFFTSEHVDRSSADQRPPSRRDRQHLAADRPGGLAAAR